MRVEATHFVVYIRNNKTKLQMWDSLCTTVGRDAFDLTASGEVQVPAKNPSSVVETITY